MWCVGCSELMIPKEEDKEDFTWIEWGHVFTSGADAMWRLDECLSTGM